MPWRAPVTLGARMRIQRAALIWAALFCLAGLPARAHVDHDLDQQAFLTIDPELLSVMVVISASSVEGPEVFAELDLDSDGVISADEAQALGADILAATRLVIDGEEQPLVITDIKIPDAEEMAAGGSPVLLISDIDLGGGSLPHDVSLSVTFHQFGLDWYTQPYVAKELVELMGTPGFDRPEGYGSLALQFPGAP